MSASTLDNVLKVTGRRVLPFVPIPLKRQALHLRMHKRFIPQRPLTFMDKVQWRILHDRRPIIAVGGDKLAMKHYAADKSTVRIPETLWNGPDIGPILDKNWGCEWVLKPRTGSGYAAFGSGSLRESGVTLESISNWRHMDHYRIQGVWAYGQADEGYLLEKRIPTPDGEAPSDYKFYVFDGVVRLILVTSGRSAEVGMRFYTPDWEPYEVTTGTARTKDPLGPVTAPPEHLDEMLRVAAEIGAEYDFIRVDLYDVPEGVYFGEVTPYPTGGMATFSDEAFNRMLGDWWTLPPLSEVK
jgi:hypothetical protein